jgi:uncharacterized protein (TIGR00725 family)
MRNLQIGVIGDSSCSDDVRKLAYDVGKEIAINKATLICGGRGGVMLGASQGCKENGGLVIGILPGLDEETSEANPYLDVAIPTNLGWTRNSIVPMACDGVIAIGGKAGTLSEISYAWMYNKPIVSLVADPIPSKTWGKRLAGESLDSRRSDKIWKEERPEIAVKLLISKIKKALDTT